MLKIAMLVPDNRDELRQYSHADPFFGPAPTALLEGLARIPECEIHLICCVQKAMRSPIRLEGGIFYHSLLVPKWGWLRGGYFGCIRAIKKKIEEIKPDLVHGQGTERYCALAAAYSGYPNIVTIHGNMVKVAKFQDNFSLFHWITARLENMALRRTLGVICNSEYTESIVKPRTRRTWRVPNAIQNQFFSHPVKKSPGGQPILLNIGVIHPLKRQIELLKMAEALHAQGARFVLQFVGKLDEQSCYGRKFSFLISAAEKQGFACYLGTKSRLELLDCMDAASALIHCPSEEAFGLVVAEALARNLKFFGARIGGVIDIASGVEGTELFEAEDWKNLGEAIRNWIQAGCPQPSTAASTMCSRYHPDIVAKRHLAIYQEILNSRKQTILKPRK